MSALQAVGYDCVCNTLAIVVGCLFVSANAVLVIQWLQAHSCLPAVVVLMLPLLQLQ